MISDIKLMSFPVIGNCILLTEKPRERRAEEIGMYSRARVLCMSDGFFPPPSESAYVLQSPTFNRMPLKYPN